MSCASFTFRKSAGVGSYSCGSTPGLTNAATSTWSSPTCCTISVSMVENDATLILSAARAGNTVTTRKQDVNRTFFDDFINARNQFADRDSS